MAPRPSAPAAVPPKFIKGGWQNDSQDGVFLAIAIIPLMPQLVLMY